MKQVKKSIQFAKLHNSEEVRTALAGIGAELPCTDDLSPLKEPVQINSKHAPNAMAVHPCEGFDGTPDGKPSEFVFRRYDRYARGGSGIIWYESIAIASDGRCNPLQMVLTKDTVGEVKRLVKQANAAAVSDWGRRPYNILQLTHSGRRSVDANWNPMPLATVNNPYLDNHNSIDGRAGKLMIANGEKIEQIIKQFIDSAELALEAGFDSVDIKLCHEYILRELLASFTREGKYGGSFENRSRAVFTIIDGIRNRLGNAIDVCVRLNAYDCIPYPYGWGMVQKQGVMEPDLTEPIRLCSMLVKRDVTLINLSTMMPRYQPTGAGYMAEFRNDVDIEPYNGVAALLSATREIKAAVPGGIFVATGLSWFEQFGCNIAAACIKNGWFNIAGFGRQAMAYPDYARDILNGNGMRRNKCCITCDKCYDLIQKGHTITGCVMRDQTVYMPVYKEKVIGRKK
jgi:2,4-dienoyl-CoA reductase-like NADH-dependent reductase (Old Yellow Enzyme family)